ncbi:MAG: GIY-YIG nuclease family protein [Kiritimatiellia bacterium]
MDGIFYYVYILRSCKESDKFYTGFTENIEDRLKHHNSGMVPATSPYRPWTIKTCLAFSNREQALAFERYLKTHSGRAFAIKRL